MQNSVLYTRGEWVTKAKKKKRENCCFQDHRESSLKAVLRLFIDRRPSKPKVTH